MGHSSILGADHAPTQAAGRDSGALGPSDSSDSGSDISGEFNREESQQQLSDLHTPRPPGGDTLHESELASDTDSSGTGERATAIEGENVREGGDIAPDRIVSADGLMDEPLTDDWEEEETVDSAEDVSLDEDDLDSA